MEHLIGKENDGFMPIMNNLCDLSLYAHCVTKKSNPLYSNHERFVFAAMSNRYARVCLEDAIKYARERQTFGKRLIDHQVRAREFLVFVIYLFFFFFSLPLTWSQLVYSR